MRVSARSPANRSGGTVWSFGRVEITRLGVRRRGMGTRLTPGRLLLCAAVLVALAFVTSACGGGSAAGAANDPPLEKYSDQFVSFTYPSAWAASAPKGPTEMHFHPLVYLGTQPVGAPCVVNGNTTSCNEWPIKSLAPGGVVALWQLPYALPTPGGKVVHRGTEIQVGGHPAWRQDVVGGNCRSLGATRTIDVQMPAKGLELTVCLRAPGIGQAEKSVNALLASVKFASQ